MLINSDKFWLRFARSLNRDEASLNILRGSKAHSYNVGSGTSIHNEYTRLDQSNKAA